MHEREVDFQIIYSKVLHKCQEIVERFCFANKKIMAIMAVLERRHQTGAAADETLSRSGVPHSD